MSSQRFNCSTSNKVVRLIPSTKPFLGAILVSKGYGLIPIVFEVTDNFHRLVGELWEDCLLYAAETHAVHFNVLMVVLYYYLPSRNRSLHVTKAVLRKFHRGLVDAALSRPKFFSLPGFNSKLYYVIDA